MSEAKYCLKRRASDDISEELRRQGISVYTRLMVTDAEGNAEPRLYVTTEAFDKTCDLLSAAVLSDIKRTKTHRFFKKAIAVLMILVFVLGYRCYELSSRVSSDLPSSTANTPVGTVPKENIMGDSKLHELAQQEREAKANNPTPISFTNGKIINYPVDEGVCPFSVSVSGSESYYIYLKSLDSSYNDMSFMVKPNMTAEVDVPLGEYEVYYACGNTWYGQNTKFGEDTSYNQCYGTFDFYIDGDYYQGWELELYPQVNGNMNTKTISENSFPG